MEIAMPVLAEWAARLSWPLGRVVGFFLTAPVFAGRTLPARVKIGLLLALTLLLAPVVEPPAAAAWSAPGAGWAMREVAIGGLIGLTVRLVVEAVAFGGQVVGLSMGLGFGQTVDPVSGAQMPAVGQFYSLLATLLFLAMDGHLALIQMLATSFERVPIAGAGLEPGVAFELVRFAGVLFAGAVQVALPAVAAIVVVNLGFGVMSRAAPSMNLFAVGFPAAMAAGFVAVWISLPTVLPAFGRLLEEAMEKLAFLLGGVA